MPSLVRATRIFSILFLLLVSYQTILLTVVPLEAHDILGNAQRVSMIYLVIGIATMLGRQLIPWMMSALGRRRVFGVGCAAMVASSALLAQRTLIALAPGMLLNALSFAIIEISLNLYLLDNLPRAALTSFEPLRIVRTTPAWLLGPWLGVFLANHVATWTPFAAAAGSGVCLLILFLWLGLREGPASLSPMTRSPNPLSFFPRYFRQKRLLLAWLLAVGRGSWWSMYWVYAPIFAVSHGLGDNVAGLLVSLGAGCSAFAVLWRRVGTRIGMRQLLFWAFAISGVVSVAVAPLTPWPWIAALALGLAAFVTEIIDAAGNSLFLRAVHPYERAQMTAVFISYRDAAQVAPPAIFSALLVVFPLQAVFVTSGLMMLGMSRLTRFVPRRF